MIQLHIMTLAIDLGIEGAVVFSYCFAAWWLGDVSRGLLQHRFQLNSVIKTLTPHAP